MKLTMKQICKVLLFGAMLLGVYDPPIQAATLVNQWKFDGNVNDTSGNNNNGTLAGGGSSYGPGVFGGQGLYLGTNDMVITTNAVDLPSAANSDWSMNLWLYLTNDSVPLAYVAGFGSYTGPAGASRCLIVYGGTDNQDIYVWGYSADLDSGVAYPLNQWVMVTVTHSGVSALTSVYTNGVHIFDGPQSLAAIPAPTDRPDPGEPPGSALWFPQLLTASLASSPFGRRC